MNKIFSNKDFNVGDIVEECSVTFLRSLPANITDSSIFHIEKTKKIIVDGNSCLYKHSEYPNLKYSCTRSKLEIKNGKPKLKPRTVIFTALKRIKKGEELSINYKQLGGISKTMQ